MGDYCEGNGDRSPKLSSCFRGVLVPLEEMEGVQRTDTPVWSCSPLLMVSSLCHPGEQPACRPHTLRRCTRAFVMRNGNLHLR
ncbi:hypothetical protein SKAU_G00172840 [Synaphobranchus kaupii]|uniref:Uncharacterized protein n=1 Tax=Synaphobranchus kaupii TaxID=118154 RepID=A0A9Q1FL92_SYNKA|nr:hypothetical protein SKAU_G00172840 [Synaphobranchus kaupii]